MSAFRYEIAEGMVLDIARDLGDGATWAWLSRQYGIPPQSLKRAFLRKSAEMYSPERTRALLDRARQQVSTATTTVTAAHECRWICVSPQHGPAATYGCQHCPETRTGQDLGVTVA